MEGYTKTPQYPFWLVKRFSSTNFDIFILAIAFYHFAFLKFKTFISLSVFLMILTVPVHHNFNSNTVLYTAFMSIM